MLSLINIVKELNIRILSMKNDLISNASSMVMGIVLFKSLRNSNGRNNSTLYVNC